jgi:hypothetical protein
VRNFIAIKIDLDSNYAALSATPHSSSAAIQSSSSATRPSERASHNERHNEYQHEHEVESQQTLFRRAFHRAIVHPDTFRVQR